MKKIIILGFIALCIISLSTMAFSDTIQLPQTGQTKCFDTSGNQISCAGTGQDGDIQAGVAWPSPRFTDHGDGTVTDNLTGLMWAKDANMAGTLVSWQQALDYVKTINTGGYSDWRLPNVNELKSLSNYNYDAESDSITWLESQGFTNVQYDGYWSSTTVGDSLRNAWVVIIDEGVSDSTKSDSDDYVWPVRAGQCGTLINSSICLSQTGQNKCYDKAGNEITCTGTGQDGDIQAGVAWPNPRFTDNGNGTVTDNLTGLMWTKDNSMGATLTWQGALDYVKTIKTGGYSDWRLPNVNELKSLIDYSGVYLDYPFTNLYGFWSSTTLHVGPDSAVLVDMGGWVQAFYKSYTSNAWPVRGRQVGPVTTTTVSSTTTTTIPIGTTTTTIPGGTTTTTTAGTSTTTTTIQGGTTTTTTIPNGTTTTTTPKPPLCAAEAIYGENSEQTELLREYRDKVLSKTPEGQEIIKTYYKFSPTITNLLEQGPLLKNRAKAFIDSMLPSIREKVEESNEKR